MSILDISRNSEKLERPKFRQKQWKPQGYLIFSAAGRFNTPLTYLTCYKREDKHTSHQFVQARGQKTDMGFTDLVNDAGLTG